MSRQLNTMLVTLVIALLPGCQPVAEAPKAKLAAITAKDEAPKADDAMASVMVDSANYRVDREIKYTLYDVANGKKTAVGGSIVSPLEGGGAKGCCLALPMKWHSGIKLQVEWGEADRQQIFTEKYIKELEIPRYEKPADLYVVFYPEHEVEVVVSVAEPGHPEWAGRIKQSPWNQCVADFGRKVCKRATPKAGLSLEELQGFCTYLKEENFELTTCDAALRECIYNYEDEELCKRTAWGARKK